MRRAGEQCIAILRAPPRAWSTAVCLIKDCGGESTDIHTWDARLAMRLHRHETPIDDGLDCD